MSEPRRRRRATKNAIATIRPALEPVRPPADATAHPESSAGATGATHVRLGTSQTNPFAQSSDVAQLVRHAPNAGAQANGSQSNGTPSSCSHVAPAAAQYAGPTPTLGPVQRLRAHIVPLPAPMHSPPGPQVPRHV